MTDSYRVKPQRQLRNRTANAVKSQDPVKPATPPQEYQQLGGQLMDRRKYMPDPKVEQGLQALATWSGATKNEIGRIGEERERKAKAAAEKLIEQENYALQFSLKNASEVEQLTAKKAFDEARYIQLKNPYINSHYYRIESESAASLVSTKLAKWGEMMAPSLAEIEDDSSRSALIAQKADELVKKYVFLPQPWIQGKIDPVVASTKQSIKDLVTEAELDISQETINKTISKAFMSTLIEGAEFATIDPHTPEGSTFAETAIQQAYEKGWKEWKISGMPASTKAYNQWLFDNFGRLYVDNNENDYNDLSEGYGMTTILNGFGKIKTDSGGLLLNAMYPTGTGDEKISMRDRIREVLLAQQKISNQEQKQLQDTYNNVNKNWTRDTKAEINEALEEATTTGGGTDNEEIKSIRDAIKSKNAELINKGLLNMTLLEANEKIDKMLPYIEDQLPASQEAALRKRYEEEIKPDLSLSELPEDFLNEIRNTNLYLEFTKEFYKREKTKNSSTTNAAVDSIVKNGLALLTESFSKDEQITNIKHSPDKEKKVHGGAMVKPLIPEAVDLASSSYRTDARDLATKIYTDLTIRHQGDEKWPLEKIQEATLLEVNRQLFARPEYSDIDYYFDVGGLKQEGQAELTSFKDYQFGQRVAPKDVKVKGRHTANVTYTYESDNAEASFSFRSRAQPYFQNRPELAKKYAENVAIFDDRGFADINKLAVTGDINVLSADTHTAITNRLGALGIDPAEALELQIKYFNYGDVKHLDANYPEWRENLRKVSETLRTPTASTGTSDSDDNLYTINNEDLSLNGDRGVIYQLRKGNNVQTSVRIRTPFQGKVVFAGPRGGYGNQVVIEADKDYPAINVKKGDQLVTSHVAALAVKTGDTVTPGTYIALSGDESKIDSTENVSTTGKGIKPGQIHVMLYNSGGYENRANQYSQWKQRFFFDKAYNGLYSGN